MIPLLVYIHKKSRCYRGLRAQILGTILAPKSTGKANRQELRNRKTWNQNQSDEKQIISFFLFCRKSLCMPLLCKIRKTVVRNTKTPHRRKFDKCGGDLLGFGCALNDFDIQNIKQRLVGKIQRSVFYNEGFRIKFLLGADGQMTNTVFLDPLVKYIFCIIQLRGESELVHIKIDDDLVAAVVVQHIRQMDKTFHALADQRVSGTVMHKLFGCLSAENVLEYLAGLRISKLRNVGQLFQTEQMKEIRRAEFQSKADVSLQSKYVPFVQQILICRCAILDRHSHFSQE